MKEIVKCAKESLLFQNRCLSGLFDYKLFHILFDYPYLLIISKVFYLLRKFRLMFNRIFIFES